jgi:methionine--tRNA ligase
MLAFSTRRAAFTRLLSTLPRREKPYFITTPVFYVNSLPHVGHLYTCLTADVLARYQGLRARSASLWDSAPPLSHPLPAVVVLSTGTDEHGQKVAAAAAARGAGAREWSAAVAGAFAASAGAFNVSCGVFTRTSSEAHGRVVRWLWRRLVARGAIYLGRHEGWYCPSEEAFLTEPQTCRAEDFSGARGGAAPPAAALGRVAADSGHPVEWLAEENYKFALAALAPQLLRLYDGAPDFVQPPEALAPLRALVAGGELRDLSVSRLREKVPWAWPVPPPPPGRGPLPARAHSVYVWLDALCSYLTAARGDGGGGGEGGELPDDAPWEDLFPAWPADVHVVGKDILKFHALYWPAFLLAAGLPPPRRILVHGHFTCGHVKMSKSLGNVVDPMALLAPADATAAVAAAGGPWALLAPPPAPPLPPPPSTPPSLGGPFTADAIRYALLKEGPLGGDADFNGHALAQRAGVECADTLGNLAHRLLTPAFLPLGLATLSPAPLALPWRGALAAAGLRDPYGAGGPLAGAAAAAAAAAPPPGAQELPLSPDEAALLAEADGLLAAAEGGLSSRGCPTPGLAAAMSALQRANRVFQHAAPWKLLPAAGEVAAWRAAAGAAHGGAPPPPLSERSLRLAALVYALLETLRVAAILLQPAMPATAPRILAHIGLDPAAGHPLAAWHAARAGAAAPHQLRGAHPALPPLGVLFPKPPRAAAAPATPLGDASAPAAAASGAGWRGKRGASKTTGR